MFILHHITVNIHQPVDRSYFSIRKKRFERSDRNACRAGEFTYETYQGRGDRLKRALLILSIRIADWGVLCLKDVFVIFEFSYQQVFVYYKRDTYTVTYDSIDSRQH